LGDIGVVVLSVSRSSEESVSIFVVSLINVAYLFPLQAPKNITEISIGVSIKRAIYIEKTSGIFNLSKIKFDGKTK